MAPVATSHGVRLSSRPVTGRPHRWQKRASRRSSAWQCRQLGGPSAAPQRLQNRPLAGVPQAGQGVAASGAGVVVIGAVNLTPPGANGTFNFVNNQLWKVVWIEVEIVDGSGHRVPGDTEPHPANREACPGTEVLEH
jgi:hypothetical protein